MMFKPSLMTTGIGSVPFSNADEAVQFVLDADLSIPFWPQLPKRSFLEYMIPQYAAGVPSVLVSPEDEKIAWDSGRKYEDLEKFYELFMAEDPRFFPLNKEASHGFYAFEKAAEDLNLPWVKGQITGPITFSTGVVDAKKNSLYSDEELRDAVVKALARNAEWQVSRLKASASEGVVIFVDEPVLAAYGSSAYVGISEEDVRAMEGQIFEAISNAGAISGMHVCGNSDWGMAIRTGVDLVNFDAHQYGKTISLYPEDVAGLFDRGGGIAWGIVPTTEAVINETVDLLVYRLESAVSCLVEKGFDREKVLEHSALTPSCGTGSLDPACAAKVFRLLKGVRDKMRGK